MGWACDATEPRRKIELFAWLDGRFHGRLLADARRGDLEQAGIGDGRHAFSMAIPEALADGRPHVLSLAEVGGWQPTGSPFSFELPTPRLPPKDRRAPIGEADVTLLAIAKNERPYVEEWIAHHHALGFRRIVIYDNDSSDGTGADLRDNPRLTGLVEVVPWPSSAYGPDEAPQYTAYADAMGRLGRRGWIAVLDLDEFLVLRHDRTVQQFLARYADLPAIGLCWRIFGSSGRDRYEPGPVTRRFRFCGPSLLAKSISRLDRVERISVHAPILREGAVCDEVRRPLPDGSRLIQPSYRHAQVNHYFSKSWAEWLRKRQRGRADFPASPSATRPDGDFVRHDRTAAVDETIARHWPATLASMERLFPDALEQWRRAGVFAHAGDPPCQ